MRAAPDGDRLRVGWVTKRGSRGREFAGKRPIGIGCGDIDVVRPIFGQAQPLAAQQQGESVRPVCPKIAQVSAVEMQCGRMHAAAQQIDINLT